MIPSQPRPRPTAEVISIGDEMTSGARVDTNAAWLSRRLGELGISVTHHSTVGDTLQHNVDVFRIAASRVDFVVSTGGLGPTRDDLTREALAAVAGVALELRPAALQHIEALFARRHREMPDRNRVQAMFPRGSQQIVNPQGTAPGVDLELDSEAGRRCRVFALPGVPAEMQRMFDETVATRILEASGGATRLRHRVLKFFGVGESEMEQRLGEMISRDREPRVGITVSSATISLRITASGESDEACDAMIEATRREIMGLVGELYFGEGESYEQQHAIESELRRRGQSMVLVELGYAAPLGDWFAAIGPTPAFRGGLSLGDRRDLERVSGGKSGNPELDQLKRSWNADWLLLVDRYPDLNIAQDVPLPAAEVEFVVVQPDGHSMSSRHRLGGHPDILQARIAKAAMARMRQLMAESGEPVS